MQEERTLSGMEFKLQLISSGISRLLFWTIVVLRSAFRWYHDVERTGDGAFVDTVPPAGSKNRIEDELPRIGAGRERWIFLKWHCWTKA
jgi:hypothetical protein